MRKQHKLPIAVSISSALFLTACGGGNASFTGDTKPSFFADNSRLPLEPLNINPPTIDKFLDEKMAGIGQQGSPTVTSVDLDENGRITAYDTVNFGQPGVVSEICSWDGNECSDRGQLVGLKDKFDKAKEAKEAAEIAKAQADKELEDKIQARKNLSAKATAQEKAKAKQAVDEAKAKQAQAQAALRKAEATYRQADIDFSVPGPNGRQRQIIPEDGIVVMMDVNGVLHNISYNGTIDRGFLKSVQVEKLIASPDAGITKIEKIRLTDKNGNKYLQPYGGSIDREFNKVVVFDRNAVPEDSGKAVPEEIQYLDAYFRSPAASGWSYQTFGNFKSDYLNNRRDQIVGYQSIGVPATELPDKKFAIYKGIAHAYINSDKYANNHTQVTMHNYIRADFSNRELSYQMQKDRDGKIRDAIMHTFEGPNNTHVIEVRPDLNITGTAHWDKGVPRFRGTVRTAGGLTGQLDGQFYGPQAAEVGGVFGIEGIIDGSEAHYVGGFGAKRN